MEPLDSDAQESGRLIQSLREARELSQEALGDLLEPRVSQSTIARWEAGAAEPKRDYRRQLAERLGVDPATLWRITRAAS